MRGRARQHVLYMRVDAAAAALGYLQAVVASLACVCAIIYVGVAPLFLEDYGPYGRRQIESSLLASILTLGIIFGGYLITVAVLLIVGVKKRQAGYVLTYFITGVMMSGALLAGSAVCGTRFFTTLGIFVALAIYSVWLYMVYCVYNNIKLEKNINSMAYNTLTNPKEIEAQKNIKIVF